MSMPRWYHAREPHKRLALRTNEQLEKEKDKLRKVADDEPGKFNLQTVIKSWIWTIDEIIKERSK